MSWFAGTAKSVFGIGWVCVVLRTTRVLQDMDDLRDVMRQPAANVMWLSRRDGEGEKKEIDDVDSQGAVGVERDKEANAAFAKNAPVNKKQSSSGKERRRCWTEHKGWCRLHVECAMH